MVWVLINACSYVARKISSLCGREEEKSSGVHINSSHSQTGKVSEFNPVRDAPSFNSSRIISPPRVKNISWKGGSPSAVCSGNVYSWERDVVLTHWLMKTCSQTLIAEMNLSENISPVSVKQQNLEASSWYYEFSVNATTCECNALSWHFYFLRLFQWSLKAHLLIRHPSLLFHLVTICLLWTSLVEVTLVFEVRNMSPSETIPAKSILRKVNWTPSNLVAGHLSANISVTSFSSIVSFCPYH